MARLYLTYRRSDLALARQLVSDLRGRGHLVTIDVDHLVAGEEWRRVLHDAFVAADGLVVLLTQNSVDSESTHISSQYIAADIGAARAMGKVVMPMLVRGTELPSLVSDIHVEQVDGTSDADVRRMGDAIERGLQRYAEHRKHSSDYPVPVGYEHLVGAIRNFQQDTPYEKSVFVMMKFPAAGTPDAHRQLLNDMWRVITDTLAQRGLTARRADKRAYHDQLWENICVYMLGSKYGMAILEDRVASELNPNVTLEYGFMKALSRQVGLFRAEDFSHDRADLIGKLATSFSIDANDRLDEPSLQSAIHEWLSGVAL